MFVNMNIYINKHLNPSLPNPVSLHFTIFISSSVEKTAFSALLNQIPFNKTLQELLAAKHSLGSYNKRRSNARMVQVVISFARKIEMIDSRKRKEELTSKYSHILPLSTVHRLGSIPHNPQCGLTQKTIPNIS